MTPEERKQRVADLVEQIKRDVEYLRGIPGYAPVDPRERPFYEERIAGCREDIRRLEER